MGIGIMIPEKLHQRGTDQHRYKVYVDTPSGEQIITVNVSKTVTKLAHSKKAVRDAIRTAVEKEIHHAKAH
jgi:hypothetical protein